MPSDPYRLRPEDVADPPHGLAPTLRRIGPGMVLAASIVGSGELIATTTLGAQVGYSALWIIVLSCAIKPVVQAELGRYTIASGETGLEALDHLPGPRLGVGWLVWAWAALVLMRMPQYFHWSGLAEGLRLKLPPQGVATAAAVFGITGVGASELFMYPYWCVEKGYARFVGPREATPEWQRRARGWVRVMHVDIVCSMLVYTLATAAFYLLGAGVLHPRGSVPAARDMIPVLSSL